MRTFWFPATAILMFLVGPINLRAAEEHKIIFEAHQFFLSPETVVSDKEGSVRLARSVLMTDEIGATDFHQTETLSDRILAKKVFSLGDVQFTGAELFIYHGPKQVHVNGKLLEKGERLTSTGWTRWKVSPKILKVGDNEIELSGGGNLLLEPGRAPGRSFKSTDGGKTWSNLLGKNNDQPGEYLVRLRLDHHPSSGWLMTPVIDLWLPQGNALPLPRKLVTIRKPAFLQGVEGHWGVWVRTGSTPTPASQSWSAWTPLGKFQPDDKSSRHRWAQLRFDLVAVDTFISVPSNNPPEPFKKGRVSLSVPQKLEIRFETEADLWPEKSNISLSSSNSPDIRQGSTPFVYQEPSARLKLLRERHQLDKVIAPGKTEMDQLMLLRYWVRNQWHTAWQGGNASWMPPWDTLIILESKDQTDCLTMCTHYAAVFTQCCLALGWNARHCILDHHCVSEVYVDQHRKWVMMDAGNSKQRADVGLHFERNKVPMSALELHLAHKTGKTDDLQVCFTPAALAEKIAALCRPAPKSDDKLGPRPDTIPLAELKKYPVCQIENYRRYAFPARNNYLSSLLPGELYQGWSEYFYDGYCWVGDTPDDPKISPEYSRHLDPKRPQDIDWSLNWTRIHLARTSKPNELQVDLETFTPNLARLERWEEGAWKPVAAAFVWKLQTGENELRVRSVNKWDRIGAESSVKVQNGK